MGLYESAELETIIAESGERVARNTIAADLAVLSGRSVDGIWSHCSMMLAQVATGLHPYSIKVRRQYRRWIPDPAILRGKLEL
jgi:hypothetical protein